MLVRTEPFDAVVRSAGVDPERLAAEIEQRLPMAREPQAEQTGRPALTGTAQRILVEATQAARGFGSTYTDPEHVFFALVTDQETVTGQLLASAGVTPQAMQDYAQQAAAAAREGRPMPGTDDSRRHRPRPTATPRRSTSSAPTSPRAPVTAASTR